MRKTVCKYTLLTQDWNKKKGSCIWTHPRIVSTCFLLNFLPCDNTMSSQLWNKNRCSCSKSIMRGKKKSQKYHSEPRSSEQNIQEAKLFIVHLQNQVLGQQPQLCHSFWSSSIMVGRAPKPTRWRAWRRWFIITFLEQKKNYQEVCSMFSMCSLSRVHRRSLEEIIHLIF